MKKNLLMLLPIIISVAIAIGLQNSGKVVHADKPVAPNNDTKPTLEFNPAVKNVSCTFDAVMSVNVSSQPVALFTWSFTPGAVGWIDKGVGYLPATSEASSTFAVQSLPINTTTKFTMIVGSGTGTTTCTKTISP